MHVLQNLNKHFQPKYQPPFYFLGAWGRAEGSTFFQIIKYTIKNIITLSFILKSWKFIGKIYKVYLELKFKLILHISPIVSVFFLPFFFLQIRSIVYLTLHNLANFKQRSGTKYISFPTSWDCRPPVHGILQAKILEWVAISLSRGSAQPKDEI